MARLPRRRSYCARQRRKRRARRLLADPRVAGCRPALVARRVADRVLSGAPWVRSSAGRRLRNLRPGWHTTTRVERTQRAVAPELVAGRPLPCGSRRHWNRARQPDGRSPSRRGDARPRLRAVVVSRLGVDRLSPWALACERAVDRPGRTKLGCGGSSVDCTTIRCPRGRRTRARSPCPPRTASESTFTSSTSRPAPSEGWPRARTTTLRRRGHETARRSPFDPARTTTPRSMPSSGTARTGVVGSAVETRPLHTTRMRSRTSVRTGSGLRPGRWARRGWSGAPTFSAASTGVRRAASFPTSRSRPAGAACDTESTSCWIAWSNGSRTRASSAARGS